MAPHGLLHDLMLDEGEHGPLARELLVSLCGDDAQRWTTARQAAQLAITARLALWDETLAALPTT